MRLATLIVTFLVLGQAGAALGEMKIDQKLPSPALGKDLIYNIYLPDVGSSESRLPVAYLLHGLGGGRHEWRRDGRVADTLDRLIAAGELAPLIAVMPEAGKSWYVDSARFGGEGDYERAIVQDLIPGIDATYPTVGDARHRAIAGNSMGGHGALRLAFGHPDLFASVAALSPGIWKPGGVSWRSGPAGETPEERENWYPKTTGETFNFEVFKAQSPFALLGQAASRRPPLNILLAVGDDDVWKLYDGTVEMFTELRRAGLKPELRVADGGHDWRYWRTIVPEVFKFFDNNWSATTQRQSGK